MEKKYRINELLNRLNKPDYEAAIRSLPDLLGISAASFNNYRNINIDAPQDIPHTVVAKLEKYFDIEPGQLQNFEVEISHAHTIEKPALAKKYNLVKP